MWIDERGASGMAVGTTNWTASGIALHLGTNVLTVAAQNVAGYISTTTLTVTLSIASTFPLNADPVIAASMPVKAIHFTELRDDNSGVVCGLGYGSPRSRRPTWPSSGQRPATSIGAPVGRRPHTPIPSPWLG
jgi:hypothetical protein